MSYEHQIIYIYIYNGKKTADTIQILFFGLFNWRSTAIYFHKYSNKSLKLNIYFDLFQNGLWSALPYLTAWICSFPISYISDVLIKRDVLTVQASRKICNTIGEWIPAIALIGLGYVTKEEPGIARGLLIFAVASNVAIYCGHNVNHMDLSPNFAGPLMGITNTVANICSILAPLIASIIVKHPVCIIIILYYF